MHETEPQYFKKFRERLETYEPQYFKVFRKEFKEHTNHIDYRFGELDKKIETQIDNLAIATSNYFNKVGEKFDKIDDRFNDIDYEITYIKQNMATDEDVKGINEHIGRYEIRAQNVEQILLQDHKPRITDLEKKSLSK